MRNQPETLHEYNIPRLHWWFLLSSLVFVVSLVLMVWVDYSGGEIRWLDLRGDRTWKNYQREFYGLERQRIATDAKAAELRANEHGLGKIKVELEQVEKQLAGEKDEEAKAQAAVDDLRAADEIVTREFTMQKAVRDQYRSAYEAALERKNLNREDPEVIDAYDKADAQNKLVDDLDLQKQDADTRLAAAKAKLESIVGQKEELERNRKRLTSNRDLLTKRYRELTDPLVQGFVRLPLLEFAASPLRIEQIETENHRVDVSFTTVPRVDRCTTCHKAIDRKDPTPEELEWRTKHKIQAIEWSQQPQPLASHPKLDLFVSETSPHPASKYGCTVCHWGWDRETTFSRAGHTPDDEAKLTYTLDSVNNKWVEVAADTGANTGASTAATKKSIVTMTQKTAWQKNHHWEEQEFLLQPMRASKYIQASCLKCHADETHLEGAEKLDHGRRLIEQLGCWSCHKMRQLETYTTHQVEAGEDFDSICKFYEVDPDEVRRLNQTVEFKVGAGLTIPIRTLRKVGPSLYKIATKTDKEWARKWLTDPVAFKPNTYMPRFWGLNNNKDTPGRNAVEMNAITEFLFAISTGSEYHAPPVKGDAENGKKLVGQLGCMGCHVVGDRLMELKPPAELAKYMDDWDYRRFRSQGPQLAGTGSKAAVNWLFAWLKNPKQYHPQTKMPNLRLSDQEAADVAVYLGTLHNQQTDAQTVAATDPKERDAVVLEYLQSTLSLKQAKEKIDDLDDLIEMYFAREDVLPYYEDAARLAQEEVQQAALKKKYEEEFDDAVGKQATQLAAHIAVVKAGMAAARQKAAALNADQKRNVYLGSRLVARYGCFACHNINGFQDAKPIGTELSEWGSKPLSQIDFGLIDIEHTRLAFLKQKLRAPRSFDIGRIGVTRKPEELLKMSKFNLTDEQIDQIVTVIMGMTNEKLMPKEAKQLAPAEFAIERGRWMVKELNCDGCHQVEAKGWAIRGSGIPQGMEPPMLSGTPVQLQEGQRVQPDWLFGFLKAPQTGEIRPWLKVRMPAFGFSDGEANVMVKYFALEGRTEFPYQTSKMITAPEHMAAGKQLFGQLKCALCHIVEGKAHGKPLAEIPEEDLPRLAPNLSLAQKRLQRDWLVNKWLPDPLSQYPGTRMPQFDYGANLAPNVLGGDGKKQVEALVDYVLSLETASEQAVQPPPTAEKQP